MALTRKRKVLLGFGILAFLLIAIIAAMPYWAPYALRPLLKKQGVEFSEYKRQGYSRFTLRDVHYSRKNTTFSAKKIDLFQPTIFLWKIYVAHPPPENFAIISNWKLEVQPVDGSAQKRRPAEVLNTINHAVPQLIGWIPNARLENGEVRVQKEVVSIPTLTWDRGLVKATLSSIQRNQTATVTLFGTTEPKQLSFSIDPLGVDGDLQISADKQSLRISGTLGWQTNKVTVRSEMTDSWLPENAAVHAENFHIATKALDLQGYEDLHGNLSAEWHTNRFSLSLDANARPQDPTRLSPVKAVVRATGTTNSIRFNELTISTPWLAAVLSRGVDMDFHGKLLTPEAALTVDVDLSKQAFVKATGHFKGETFLRRTEKRYPLADFKLTSDAFAGYGFKLDGIKLTGSMDWPLLQINEGHVDFVAGGTADAVGRVNFITREVESGTVKIKGQLGQDFLPKNLSYTNLSLSADVTGPLEEPRHTARVEVDGLTVEGLPPLKVTANWRGDFLNIEQLEAAVLAKTSELKVTGAAKLAIDEAQLRLTNVVFTKARERRLAMQKPATLVVKKSDKTLSLHCDAIDLRGGNRQIGLGGNLAWPQQSDFSFSATNLTTAEFQDLFFQQLPDVRLFRINFVGGWTNGPLDFTLRAAGRFTPIDTNVFAIRVNASGDKSGLSFEELQVLSEREPVLVARGFLPVQINPANGTNMVQLQPKQIIDFRADTTTNTVFWDRIAELTRFKFHEPELHVLVSGTLEKPQGKIVAKAAETEWLPARQSKPLPRVRKLEADIDLDEQKARLNKFTLLVEGQPVVVSAELPLGTNLTQNWKKIFDWRKAQGTVVIDNAELSPFVKFLPEILSAQGRLSMNVGFSPGPQFNGWLTVSNAATHPLPGTGPLRDVTARLRFQNRQVEFQDVRGLLGGQPVGIFGTLDFAEMKRGLPLLNLRLRGDNVPLTRQPETIIRGDLNLSVANLTNDIPLVSGDVRLRDSFYLGDIRQVAPGRVASPKRRPPYFSIEEKPLSEWKLNVHVRGEKFLKVRSPIFTGTVSANFRLSDTLQEPLALGEAKVDEGTILFPFANFATSQGFFSLTSDDPYRPHIFMTATSRAFGYDIQMNATGPADQPNVEFTSTPSLTSDQIILMITAGEVPKKSFEISGQQRAQKLAVFLGKSLLSKFSSDDGGAERLSISTGEDISEKGRETYSLEYKLTDRWSLTGEYDRWGALNAGVKWRAYSR